MEFYKILQEIMSEKTMSIPDVARACNLSDSTVRSIIERKAKRVSLDIAFKMHVGLCVPLQRLNGDSYDISDTPLSAVKKELASVVQELDDDKASRLLEMACLYKESQERSKQNR